MGGGHLVFSAGKPGLSSYYTTTSSIAFSRQLNSLSLKAQSLVKFSYPEVFIKGKRLRAYQRN